MIKTLPIAHTEMELVNTINQLVNYINDHQELPIKVASLFDQLNGFRAVMKINGWDTELTYPGKAHYEPICEMKIPANINGIGDCIVYTKCTKCRDNFQISKTSSGKIAIYCPRCGKLLDYKRI